VVRCLLTWARTSSKLQSLLVRFTFFNHVPLALIINNFIEMCGYTSVIHLVDDGKHKVPSRDNIVSSLFDVDMHRLALCLLTLMLDRQFGMACRRHERG